jgi:hypothetical protein
MIAMPGLMEFDCDHHLDDEVAEQMNNDFSSSSSSFSFSSSRFASENQ